MSGVRRSSSPGARACRRIHMKRLMLNAVADVLLILSAAMCWLWVRSYDQFDSVRWVRRDEKTGYEKGAWGEIYSGLGTVQLSWTEFRRVPPEAEPDPRWPFYVSGVGPWDPLKQSVDDGWRRSIWGFGIAHQFNNEESKKSLERSFEADKRNVKGLLRYRAAIMYLDYRYSLWVPHWFLALLFAIPGLWPIRVWRRTRQRGQSGLCVKCGYDLRGGSEKCPECGQAAACDAGSDIHLAKTLSKISA
jgi:hypothetical protein